MPDRAVSQNASRGQSKWAAFKKSRVIKEHRMRARIMTMGAMTSDVRLGTQWAGYSLAFFFKTVAFRDEGNAEGSCKAYIDGTCDALGIDDKNFNKTKLTTRAKDAENPRVEITIYGKE
jgi:hypothetical protein